MKRRLYRYHIETLSLCIFIFFVTHFFCFCFCLVVLRRRRKKMHKLQKIATPVLCNIRKVNCPFTLCFFSVNAVPSSTFPIVTEMKHPHDKYGSFSAISRVDSGICVEWADGEKSNFHDIWIRDCCKCSQCQEANSHQKISLGVDVGVVATSTEYRGNPLFLSCQ